MVKMAPKHSAMVLMKPMASAVGDQGDLSVAYYHANQLSSYQDLRIRRMHGPRRVITFCLLIAVLPTVLLVIPLYLRHSVYADVSYQVTESEVLKIVEGISSIFCQEHSLKMNSTFTAYQLEHEPVLSPHRKHIHMKKSMSLPDDTLEYWGFYLLNGSSMTLSICSRYEGGRVMVVRGDRNLKTCGLLDRDKKVPELPHGVGKEGVGGNKVRVIFDNKAGINHKGPKEKLTTTASPITTKKPEMEILDGDIIDIDGKEVSDGDEERGDDFEVVKDDTNEERKVKSMEEAYDKSEEDDDDDGSGDFDDDVSIPAARLREALRKSAWKLQKRKLKESSPKDDDDNDRKKRHLKGASNGPRRRKRNAAQSERLERLRRELLHEKVREKREDIELVDGGLKHGGTALNYTKRESEEDSESSFELGLRECYGGAMEFQEEFSPSETCSEEVYSKGANSKEFSQSVIRIEHEISSNGYYYYIFYSDNDRVMNEVHAAFDLQKTVYEKTSNKTENPGNACVNATECNFPISFFSGSVVIVEIPTRDGIDRDIMDEVGGPQGAILISSCHPRMSVYIIFPVAVLFLILGCAFL